jgi:gluconolactonase
MKNIALSLLVLSCVFSCRVAEERNEIFGSIESADPRLDQLIDPAATLEILSDGYEWSEGPLWIATEKMLLFSDVPANTVYKWTEEDSIQVFLKPSGYTGLTPSESEEQGSNGLALTPDGKLVLCQHGDRRLAILDAPLNSPQPKYTSLADNYGGKKFNSPNDVAIRKNGDYFFTDPPYGLPKDLEQEIPFQGVYKLSNGNVTLLVDSLTRPNGVAFFPDEKTLIIANSDPEKAIWYAYDLSENDSLINGRIFYDATAAAKTEAGLPDGLKIDKEGNVFATGPGGIWIFDKAAKLLGKIKVPTATANCAFTADEKTLFLTADNYLLRLRMKE